MANDDEHDDRKELNIKMAESDVSSDRSEQVKYCMHKHSDPPTSSIKGFNKLKKEQKQQTLEQMYREKYVERYDIF